MTPEDRLLRFLFWVVACVTAGLGLLALTATQARPADFKYLPVQQRQLLAGGQQQHIVVPYVPRGRFEIGTAWQAVYQPPVEVRLQDPPVSPAALPYPDWAWSLRKAYATSNQDIKDGVNRPDDTVRYGCYTLHRAAGGYKEP